MVGNYDVQVQVVVDIAVLLLDVFDGGDALQAPDWPHRGSCHKSRLCVVLPLIDVRAVLIRIVLNVSTERAPIILQEHFRIPSLLSEQEMQQHQHFEPYFLILLRVDIIDQLHVVLAALTGRKVEHLLVPSFDQVERDPVVGVCCDPAVREKLVEFVIFEVREHWVGRVIMIIGRG